MRRVRDLIADRESWLAQRILAYARERGCAACTPILEEAWRSSVAGLSAPLLELLDRSVTPSELSPEDDLSSDPPAAVGIVEARRHRERGVTLAMFLGLMKCCRQGYVDLVREAEFPREDEEAYRRIVERFFDRVEDSVVTEWEQTSAEARVAELSAANRVLVNQRNRYLTLFESLPIPAFILDAGGAVENANRAAAALAEGDAEPRGRYDAAGGGRLPLPFLGEEVSVFLSAGVPYRVIERLLKTRKGYRHYRVHMHRMLDASGNSAGAVVTFSDVTKRREAEETLQVVLEELEARVAERTAEVARSHNLLTAVIGSTTDVVYVKDREGRYLMANPAAEQFLGSPVDEIVGKTDLELFGSAHAPSIVEADREIVDSGATRIFEEVLELGGVRRFFSSAKGPYRDGDGNVIGLFGVTREITRQKLEEEVLRRANRALRMMWQVSRTLVRATQEQELLSAACRIAVEEGGYKLAWVAFGQDDAEKTIRPAAQFGWEDGYLETLSLTWADTVRGRGPTGTAIRTGSPVVSRHIDTDPSFAPWREEALRRGYASSAALPFEGCLGALNVYSALPDAFGPEEVLLLAELAEMLAYGIRSLRAVSPPGRNPVDNAARSK